MEELLSNWHEVVKKQDARLLKSMLDKDAVFHSPILFKPQKGRKLVMTYLLAAAKMFEDTNFRYVKEVIHEQEAVLEFNAEIDGIHIDGVDIITANEDGFITEFKVMLRPLKAIEKVGEKMKANLDDMSLWDKLKWKLS
ncbi:nuclear transport factor 2 family protein [Ekhidna sp. MALMAid0563]|uniref:nuclear transport factor 2 family protein n=1 Tax=Ekhidna sp. MALMAid0563 TaxID=3143937 RepID=UPI0032DE5B45